MQTSLRRVSVVVLLVIMASCLSPRSRVSDSELEDMIRSRETNKEVHAAYVIGEKKLYRFVPYLLDSLSDPRITHMLPFKGMSVYQCKVNALQKISGLSPPCAVSHKPDTVVINFYEKWAVSVGYGK